MSGVKIRPNLPLTSGPPFLPVLEVITNENGEWFGIAPLFLLPANYLLDIDVGGVRVSGTFGEIENIFTVDLETKTWTQETLTERIPGDGYFQIDRRILSPRELLDVTNDPVREVSRCSTCLYYLPGPSLSQGFCVVNGLKTAAIPIKDAPNTSSRMYYPFFLQPLSPQRLARDFLWRVPSVSEGPEGRSIRLTPALTLALPPRPSVNGI